MIVSSGAADDARAADAAAVLRSLGFSSVSVYAGGVADWRRNGGRVRSF